MELDARRMRTVDLPRQNKRLQSQLKRFESKLNNMLELGAGIDGVAANLLDRYRDDFAADEFPGFDIACGASRECLGESVIWSSVEQFLPSVIR